MSALERGIIPQMEPHAIDQNIDPSEISDQELGLGVDGIGSPSIQEATSNTSRFFPETVIYQLPNGSSRTVRIHTSAVDEIR